MKRQALWMMGLALLVGLTALGQEQEDLTALLLPQEVLREVFSDDSWVLATVGTLTKLPPGGIGSANRCSLPNQATSSAPEFTSGMPETR